MRKLKVIDPVVRQPTVSSEDRAEGSSPFDPPDAYAPPARDEVALEDLHPFLRELLEEHTTIKAQLDDFEDCLVTIQKERALPREVFTRLQTFFEFFDTVFIAHNRREERDLFPLIKLRLLEKGEHSPTETPVTGIDVLLGEHLVAAKAVATVSALLSLIPTLPDHRSREVALDVAVGTGRDFIEQVNLHIFREDHVMFPLAHTLLTTAELDEFARH
jgi:hemerythrin-like domain-containing protein